MEVINFNYEGNEIPFQVDGQGEVFMDATVMVNPFPGKRVNNFLRNKNTLEYINAIHEERGAARISVATDFQLVKAKMGGLDQGTWFQEDLALEFALWLNPKFRLRCNQRIKEILTKGFSALTEEATDYIEDQIGEDVRMINLLIQQIIEGAKQPGRTMQKYIHHEEGNPDKIYD